mgnify:CR=1 FL=1
MSWPRTRNVGVSLTTEPTLTSPHTKTSPCAGNGSTVWGAGPSSVGHRFAFGSNLEFFTRMVYGVAQRGGQRGDPPLPRTTGLGWVREVAGHYADALSRTSEVYLLLHESYGGMHPGTEAYRARPESMAKRTAARDDTPYHDPPGTKRLSYLEHWARERSIEAALGDAARIARRITRVANHTDRAANATAAVAAHAGAAV